jgi:hypothetical protein
MCGINVSYEQYYSTCSLNRGEARSHRDMERYHSLKARATPRLLNGLMLWIWPDLAWQTEGRRAKSKGKYGWVCGCTGWTCTGLYGSNEYEVERALWLDVWLGNGAPHQATPRLLASPWLTKELVIPNCLATYPCLVRIIESARDGRELGVQEREIYCQHHTP